MKSYRLHRKCC